MKSLYHIEKEYLELAAQLEDGELTPEIEAALAINENQLQGKAIAYAYVIKDAEATIDVIDAEIARLAALKKAEQRKAERLKSSISSAMQFYGISEVKSETMKLSFRKSEALVEEVAFTELPDEFITVIPESRKPNNAAIKAALKEGREIEGYRIEVKQNLQIK